MNHKILLAVLIFTLSIVPLSRLFAYEGGAISNGGTIEGVVKFNGAPPPAKKIQITKDQGVCGKTKNDPSLIVSSGDVENAVVFITDIKKGKTVAPIEIKLDQRNCEYIPHVLAFPAGSTLEVLNSDGILHNIHSFSKQNSPFNYAQPKFKKVLSVKIDKPEIINIKCDVHDWMNGWLFSADNPYYSVTDAHGSFKLTDVPPGTYTIKVWHETLGTLTREVTVKPKEATKITFDLVKK